MIISLSIFLAAGFLIQNEDAINDKQDHSFRNYASVHDEFTAKLEQIAALACDTNNIPCLNKALEKRGDLDQLARNRSHLKGDCFDGLGFTNNGGCTPIMLVVDQANIAFLDPLLEHHGFPTGNDWSDDAITAAFLIIQHGNPFDDNHEANTIRREVHLPAIRQAVLYGRLYPFGYAAMYDRIQFHREGKQTYATQFNCHGTKAYFKGIPDRRIIDKARTAIGFYPFEETLNIANNDCAKNSAQDWD